MKISSLAFANRSSPSPSSTSTQLDAEKVEDGSLTVPSSKDTKKDEKTFAATGISREDHENRNMLNELPTGLLRLKKDDERFYEDDAGRSWRLSPDPTAAYHQPYPLAIAFIRAHISQCFLGFLRVPNQKLMSPNKDGTYSEICVNRYTGELIIDAYMMGTYNFCKDTPDAMEIGNLPNGGDHKKTDIIPHNEYGRDYKHIAKGIPVGSLDKAPVVMRVNA